MIKSMTGYGSARADTATRTIGVEVRSVNARFLKVTVKAPPVLAAREHDLEALVRERVRRGTVTLGVQFKRTGVESLVSVNEEVARAYQTLFRRLGLAEDSIPLLPGVVAGNGGDQLAEEDWQAVRAVAVSAIDAMVAMREREGRALHAMLHDHRGRIAALRAQVIERVPTIVAEYRARLKERVDLLLRDVGTTLDAVTLAREVAVLADRSDATEELDRLAAHLEQLHELLDKDDDMVGRTLDFLAQEILREVNTLGSKSADANVARLVIDLKTEVERLKEQVANVE